MNHLTEKIKNEKGSLVIIFALLFPLVFSFFSLAFDGTRILTKKAHFSDVLFEAALIVATASSYNPTQEEIKSLNVLLADYVKSHFPNDTLISASVAVSDIESGIPIFAINAKLKFNTLLPFKVIPAFPAEIGLSNTGKVRKGGQTEVYPPADYAIVVDFSGSMTLSMPGGYTRESMLKKVVKEVTTKTLENSDKNTFALIPFDDGVPERLNKKNLAGGEMMGCSFPITSEDSRDINYQFWSMLDDRVLLNMHSELYSLMGSYKLSWWNSLSDQEKDLHLVNFYNNMYRYNYNHLKFYIRHSLIKVNPYDFPVGLKPLPFFGKMVESGNCEVKVGAPPDTLDGNEWTMLPSPYTCIKHKDYDLRSDAGKKIIRDDIAKVVNTYDLASDPYVFIFPNNNITRTLNNIFSDSNITTVVKNPPMRTPQGILHPMFGGVKVCQSAYPHSKNSAVNPHNYLSTELGDVKSNTYLIDSTNDINELEKLQFMKPIGQTNSLSGLLRAVPILTKGTNPRRVLILISDGEDSFVNNWSINEEFHEKAKVCDKIRNEMKDHSEYQVEQVEIYYISLVDHSPRMKYWADHCTGQNNAIIATSYENLLKMMNSVVSKSGSEETGFFYGDEDEEASSDVVHG